MCKLGLLAFILFALIRCSPLPQNRRIVDALDFKGNNAVASDEIEKRLATRESPKFLWLFDGVLYDYELFDRYVLERDLQRIERYYRARGFYQARARAGRVFVKGVRKVRVEILIDEGPATTVSRVDIHGTERLPLELAEEAKKALSPLAPGKRFEESVFEDTATNLASLLASKGYAHAKVNRAAQVDLPKSTVAVGFWIKPGVLAHYGKIRILGLSNIPEAPVRRALDLKEGDPYSRAELNEAERALLDLGIFSAVRIEADPEARADPRVVPLNVVVQVSKLRNVHLGFGVQSDSLKTGAHLIGGWEDSNFLGGLRHLSIALRPGVILYPTRLPGLQAPTDVLPQGRLRVDFSQPGLIEARTNLIVGGDVSIYPVLLSTKLTPSAPLLGYRDTRARGSVERTLWRAYGALTHSVQRVTPFTYRGMLDADLDPVLIGYPELFTSLDLRDNAIHPRKGGFFANNLQLAGLTFGNARDIKVRPEARGYLPISRKVTLAGRAEFGFIFNNNYGQTTEANAQGERDNVTLTPLGVSRKQWVRDVQLSYLRGFFGGGPASNRGYAEGEIGPRGVVPFYNPGQSTQQISSACDNSPGGCEVPLGGLSLWEASLELRFPLAGPLGGALFSDLGDVAARRFTLRWRPHFSVGIGLRYETPIGPVRLDVGYRVPGAQGPVLQDEGRSNELFGAPMAVAFGIGEAF